MSFKCNNIVECLWQSLWIRWHCYCKYDPKKRLVINNIFTQLTNFVIWFTKLCQNLTKTMSFFDKLCHVGENTMSEWQRFPIVMSFLWQSLSSHVTKFVIEWHSLSFNKTERSKYDILLCHQMTKFVINLTSQLLNDKVVLRDVPIPLKKQQDYACQSHGFSLYRTAC